MGGADWSISGRGQSLPTSGSWPDFLSVSFECPSTLTQLLTLTKQMTKKILTNTEISARGQSLPTSGSWPVFHALSFAC